MPFKPSDALKHTKQANTPAKQKQWAKVANSSLIKGQSEGRAIRQANAVVRDNPAKGKS